MGSSSTQVPAAARRWVSTCLDGAQVVSARRLTGGLSSTVHAIRVESRAGARTTVVLRRYTDTNREVLVTEEAAALGALRGLPFAVPQLLGTDLDGARSGGCPSLLMTGVGGRMLLTPTDRGDWLEQVAAVSAAIHAHRPALRMFEPWLQLDGRQPPSDSRRVALWHEVHNVVGGPPPTYQPCFIHRDFQHFNFLWTRQRLTGVIDWTHASTGPAALDLGHCRLNLAVLFGADWADELRRRYEAIVGAPLDPWWDLHSLANYDDDWQRFIPVQVAGRRPVDTAGMTARVETAIAATLRRI